MSHFQQIYMSLNYSQGMDEFKGKLMHTRAYKNERGYEGNRVVVVGIGNAAVDAACDVSPVAGQVV